MASKFTYLFANKERIKQKLIAGQELDDDCFFSFPKFKTGCEKLNIPYRSNDRGEYPKTPKNWFIKKQNNEEL